MLINGCSNEVKRTAASFMLPNCSNPSGETKYKIKPTNNCIWQMINVNKDKRKSLLLNNFLDVNPEMALIEANNNKPKAAYAKTE